MKNVIYKGKRYSLMLMTQEEVLGVPGTKHYHLKLGLMTIENDIIYYYNIPEKFLEYAVVHEIECPDMTHGLGIEALKIELGQVPFDTLEDYKIWRRSFFENILDYWYNLTKDDLTRLELTKEYQKRYIVEIKSILEFLGE